MPTCMQVVVCDNGWVRYSDADLVNQLPIDTRDNLDKWIHPTELQERMSAFWDLQFTRY